MTWDQTYSHTVALAVDRFGAAVIFNEPDMTISSLCWVVREGTASQQAAFNLHPWQRIALKGIGAGLEHYRPGHCGRAKDEDVLVSARTQHMLGTWPA